MGRILRLQARSPQFFRTRQASCFYHNIPCLHRRIGTDGADGTWHPKTRLKQRYILR